MPTADAGVSARAPGRVNLIGDHTDYNDGLALPMAVDLFVETAFAPFDADHLADRVLLSTEFDPGSVEHPVELPLALLRTGRSPHDVGPRWAALAAAVLARIRPRSGGHLRTAATLPAGAGLSSSAAYAVSLACVFGIVDPIDLARLCQGAEAAVGARVGLMDPLVIAGARRGTAMLIDFSTLQRDSVPVPPGVEVVVVHSGEERDLAATPYAERRSECEDAARRLGTPLGHATESDLTRVSDARLRRRARHVVSECRRVRDVAEAFRAGDPTGAGALLTESHRSLADDLEATTPALDELVATLCARRGVFGARMTGGGFGGCAVALCEPGALSTVGCSRQAWVVAPAGGVEVQHMPD